MSQDEEPQPRPVVDVALEEADRDESDLPLGPTYLLRFKTVKTVHESLPPLKKGGKARIRETERSIHVGSIRLEPSGKIESDLRSAVLHGLLALDVFPLIDDEKLHLFSEGAIDRLQEACERVVKGRFVIERVEVDDDEDALASLRESITWGSNSPDWGGQAAPWTPLPLRPTRVFLEENPDAQVEIIFPTVYEEDRSKKIQDLATAEGLKVISHRRMSEQMAKELQQEQYDYDEEQEDIQLHPSPVTGALASAVVGQGLGLGTPGGVRGQGADALVKGIMGAVPKPAGAPAPPTQAELAAGHKPGMDATSRAAFRSDQKSRLDEAAAPLDSPYSPAAITAVLDELRTGFERLTEAIQRPSGGPGEREAVQVTVPSLVPPASHIHVPPPQIHIAPAEPRRRRVEYDEEGRIIGLVDEPAEAEG